MTHYVLILAGGVGSRLQNKIPKQFLEIDGRIILMHSINAFYNADSKSKIYVALPNKNILQWKHILQKEDDHIQYDTYVGGIRRIDTVYLGIKKIIRENRVDRNDLISIHDAARPFINTKFILFLIKYAKKHGNSVPVMPLKSSLRKMIKPLGLHNFSSESKNRSNYYITQTPQTYLIDEIYKSYNKLYKLEESDAQSQLISDSIFDDGSVYDSFKPKKNAQLHLTNGREYNIKITTAFDYFIAPQVYSFFKHII